MFVCVVRDEVVSSEQAEYLLPLANQFHRSLQGFLYSCNHDPMVATPSGYNDKQGISVWPRGGRTSLDAAR